MLEIGYFDIYLVNNNVNYSGVWNVYLFFVSGNIVISGGGGFILVKELNFSINDNEDFNFIMIFNFVRENIIIFLKDIFI